MHITNLLATFIENILRQLEIIKKYYYTYQTKNLVNGKTYIGVHATNILDDGYIGHNIKRQSCVKGILKSKSKSHFVRAVAKHGYESFRKEILSFYNSYAEALEEEAFLVDDAWVKSTTNYNLAIGGKGGFPKQHTHKYDNIAKDFLDCMSVEDIRDKYNVCTSIVAEALKDVDKLSRNKTIFYNKNKDFAEVVKNKLYLGESIAKICKDYSIDFYTVKKIIDVFELSLKPVQVYIGINIDGEVIEFTDRKKTAKNLGVSYECLNQVVRGVTKTTQEWCFLKKENYNPDTFIFPIPPSKTYRDIILKDPQGNLHKIGSSLPNFCEAHKLTYTSIYHLIQGNYKVSKGWTLSNINN